VYGLRQLFEAVRDGRRKPTIASRFVAAVVFYTGLLRIRSFNALEPKLSEKAFLRLVGTTQPTLCSVDTLSRSLNRSELDTVGAMARSILAKAERNKVFREGWYGALRYFAVDGWEPICSRKRHCSACLVRTVRVKAADGQTEDVLEFYHRYVVALLIGERFDLVLDFEPVLTKDVRPAVTKGRSGRLVRPAVDEGELTTCLRLVRRVKQTFPWLDVVVADALYANGPFLSLAQTLGLGAVIVARKPTDEPLKEALRLWSGQPPRVVEDWSRRERIELWDCPDLETLDTYEGKIRVVRAQVSQLNHPEKKPSTWCLLATGPPAKRLSAEKLLAVVRARWHIENTGFHQWTSRWHFTHVFTHDPTAIQALYWLFFAAFNLLTLFLYCQLRSYGRDRGRAVTQTISRLVDEMLDELPTFAFDSS
jgi:hypothetical protein